MQLREFFAEQLEREASTSRKVIERVPEGRYEWKPHARSMDLGNLASLVASMPGWIALMIDFDELDLNGNGKAFRTGHIETKAELLSMLEDGLTQSRRALANTSEEHLYTTWRLKMDDRVLTEGLRHVTIADGALSHLAHHRGQLTVYLRLVDAKVPAVYGPSADEWE